MIQRVILFFGYLSLSVFSSAQSLTRLDGSKISFKEADSRIESLMRSAKVTGLAITVFNNNTGAGTQFAALGSAVVKRARDMGLGREIPTEWFLEDVSP